ncbi:MAG: MBL fold metallo-hydrolase, partial [Erysipelotrichaceae bacterium]|nr:MBL fold metallo-hydrolase [Erysipelotrichaceae bacterium]
LLLMILSPFNNPLIHVKFIDVGQGDSILIKYGMSRKNVLIDTGSVYNYSKLQKALNSEGIYSIDHLIISHDDSDHNGNVERLKRDYKIRNIIEYSYTFDYYGIHFENLPTGDHDNDNDDSLVYMINIDGLNFLFTGDISSRVESSLVRNCVLDVDILKASHHGSKTSSSEFFISSIQPEYAVFSTSGQYGHPHKEVVETMEKYDVRCFDTSKDGSVSFYFSRVLDFVKTDKNEFVIIR